MIKIRGPLYSLEASVLRMCIACMRASASASQNVKALHVLSVEKSYAAMSALHLSCCLLILLVGGFGVQKARAQPRESLSWFYYLRRVYWNAIGSVMVLMLLYRDDHHWPRAAALLRLLPSHHVQRYGRGSRHNAMGVGCGRFSGSFRLRQRR